MNTPVVPDTQIVVPELIRIPETDTAALDGKITALLVQAKTFREDGLVLFPEAAGNHIRTTHGTFNIGGVKGFVYAQMTRDGRVVDVSVKKADGHKLLPMPGELVKISESDDFRYSFSADKLVWKVTHAQADRAIVLHLLKWLKHEVILIIIAAMSVKHEADLAKGKRLD